MKDEDRSQYQDYSSLERPLECCECKKPIVVCYTEAVGSQITRYGMCKDCPVLAKKMHGHRVEKESSASLCCGSCGVTLEEVKKGASLGCPLCYEIYAEEIFHELEILGRLPARFERKPFHCGRLPGQQQELDPSLKLLSLQQALHDTLGREDYEAAAQLRDQIKELEDNQRKQGDSHDKKL